MAWRWLVSGLSWPELRRRLPWCREQLRRRKWAVHRRRDQTGVCDGHNIVEPVRHLLCRQRPKCAVNANGKLQPTVPVFGELCCTTRVPLYKYTHARARARAHARLAIIGDRNVNLVRQRLCWCGPVPLRTPPADPNQPTRLPKSAAWAAIE